MIRKRPTLYEWKSAGDANVEFQFRTSSTGTDQGFKLRLRCDRKQTVTGQAHSTVGLIFVVCKMLIDMYNKIRNNQRI